MSLKLIYHPRWEPDRNLIPEMESYCMEMESRVRYARLRRDGHAPKMHKRRIDIVDDFIIRMMKAN